MAADPRFIMVYREYARAIRGYENAIRDRRRVRKHLRARRLGQARVRRPVGSPADFRIPQEPARPAPPAAPARAVERRIYLGEILGWATIRFSPTVTPQADSVTDLDTDKLYDTTSLHLYWNAKRHYEKCKREFFEHARRQNRLPGERADRAESLARDLERHRQRAARAAIHQANLQFLGADNGEGSLDQMRSEVEAACRNALELYRNSPQPKSDDIKVVLIENLADAQLVGLESPTVSSMETELGTLVKSGAVKLGRSQVAH